MDYKEYKKMVEEKGYTVYKTGGWLLLEKRIGNIENKIRIKTDLKSSVHISFSEYDPDVFKATLDLLGMVEDDKEEQLIKKEYKTEDLIGLDYIESQIYEKTRNKKYRGEYYYNLEDTLNDVFLMWLIKLIKAKENDKDWKWKLKKIKISSQQ